MFGLNKKYLSISINEGAIKLAQLTSTGVVEKIARSSAESASSSDDVARMLKTSLSSFDKSAQIICVIPANATTTKGIEVPSADPEEIKSIINLQVGRHTPYSREEVLIGHINLGAAASGNTRILLVIAHRDVVKERITVLEKSGLNVDKILFSPEGVAKFYAKALNLKKESPAYGLIDISLNSTTYMVLVKNSLAFVRHIPVGIKSILEGSEVVTKLQDELKKSIEAYVQEEGGNEPLASYAVTTDHEAVRNILPALKESLAVDFQINSFSNFIKDTGGIKRKLQKDFADDSFLDVISIGACLLKSEINLMPEEMVLKKTVERQSKEASGAGVAAVLIMVLVGAMIMSNIYFKDTFLKKNLREHFSSQRTEVQELEKKMSKSKLVKKYLKGRMVSLEIIHELYSITPNTIYLNNISVDDEGNINVVGISESMSQVFSYVKALDDSSMFKEVKTKSTATKKENGKDVAAFEMVLKLENSKENM